MYDEKSSNSVSFVTGKCGYDRKQIGITSHASSNQQQRTDAVLYQRHAAVPPRRNTTTGFSFPNAAGTGSKNVTTRSGTN